MEECTVCSLCQQGQLSTANEVVSVPSCVLAFAEDRFTVWRCSNCNSIHSKEVTDLEAYYAVYPFKNHTLDFHTRIAYKNRLKMLRRQGVTEHSSILDYGCGVGLFLDFLREQGFRNLFGYDAFIPKYSDSAVLQKQFDVVTSYDVIEHVEQPREYLQTLISLVAEGGNLVLGTPNADYIPLRASPYFPVELSQPYHRHILSEKVLLKLASDFGLSIVHAYRRFYYDSWYPGVNTRFMWEYINATGGMLDVCVEPPKMNVIRRSPKLMFYAFFGYLFPPRGNILLTLRKTQERKPGLARVANG